MEFVTEDPLEVAKREKEQSKLVTQRTEGISTLETSKPSPQPLHNIKPEKVMVTQRFGRMKCKYKELHFEGEVDECKKMIEWLIQINF